MDGFTVERANEICRKKRGPPDIEISNKKGKDGKCINATTGSQLYALMRLFKFS